MDQINLSKFVYISINGASSYHHCELGRERRLESASVENGQFQKHYNERSRKLCFAAVCDVSLSSV